MSCSHSPTCAALAISLSCLQLPITELFTPVTSYAAAAPGDKSSSIALRGAAAAVLAAACYGLYAVGPNADTMKDNLQGARDSVLNYFVSAVEGFRGFRRFLARFGRLFNSACSAAGGAVLAAACYGLYALGPSSESVKDNLQGARDSVLNYFVSISISCLGSVCRFALCWLL